MALYFSDPTQYWCLGQLSTVAGRQLEKRVVDIKQELFKRSREQGQEKTNISPLGKRDKRDFSMFSSSASFLFPSPASASAPSPLTSFPYLGDNHGQWSWSSMMMCFLVEMIVTWPQNDFPKLGKKIMMCWFVLHGCCRQGSKDIYRPRHNFPGRWWWW